MRLALRGFKEPQTEDEVNFSATAQRISQQILASEASLPQRVEFRRSRHREGVPSMASILRNEQVDGRARKTPILYSPDRNCQASLMHPWI